MICCPCGGEATVGMNLTDVTNKFVGNRYDRMSTIQLELYLYPYVEMEFANKRQLNTFVMYERACNLLFSTNDIPTSTCLLILCS